MLVAPNKIRKFLFEDFIKLVPITAACPDPRPGRKLVKGAVNIEAIKGGKKSFLDIFGLEMICFFILTFDLMLIINEEAPNKPESNGRKGSFTGE